MQFLNPTINTAYQYLSDNYFLNDFTITPAHPEAVEVVTSSLIEIHSIKTSLLLQTGDNKTQYFVRNKKNEYKKIYIYI